MATELRIELFEPGADAEAVDALTGALREELLELDVEDVAAVTGGSAPDGSKGLELIAIGALLVQVKDSLTIVRSVVNTVQEWLGRGGSSRRSLKISVEGRTLELSAATADQQERLVSEFIRSLDS
jgi:hypothetical protein